MNVRKFDVPLLLSIFRFGDSRAIGRYWEIGRINRAFSSISSLSLSFSLSLFLLQLLFPQALRVCGKVFVRINFIFRAVLHFICVELTVFKRYLASPAP